MEDMRRTLENSTALTTDGGPLQQAVPGERLATLRVGGYLGGTFELTGAPRPAGSGAAFPCADGEIYFKDEDVVERLSRA